MEGYCDFMRPFFQGESDKSLIDSFRLYFFAVHRHPVSVGHGK